MLLAERSGEDIMTKRVSAELIRRQAEELQRFSVPEGRAETLAGEVEALNSAVFEAALELDFDDEPAAFPRALRAARPEEPTDD
jgi:hypothetical protein